MLAGQFNFRGSLPRSENNALQPILHPGPIQKKYVLDMPTAHTEAPVLDSSEVT